MILHHNIGYTIFQETEQFSRALPKSAQRITPEKIWTNFKTHFQEASNKYIKFGATASAEAIFLPTTGQRQYRTKYNQTPT